MPRHARQTPAGYVYLALNRATARLKLFRKPADYAAFLRVFDEALERHPIRVLGYCLMPTHWHVEKNKGKTKGTHLIIFEDAPNNSP